MKGVQKGAQRVELSFWGPWTAQSFLISTVRGTLSEFPAHMVSSRSAGFASRQAGGHFFPPKRPLRKPPFSGFFFSGAFFSGGFASAFPSLFRRSRASAARL